MKESFESVCDAIPDTEALLELGERWNRKGSELSSDELAQIQRKLAILARDASQVACSLYTLISIAKNKELLAKLGAK